MNRKPLRMVNVFDPNIVTRTNLADAVFAFKISSSFI